jgi:hypothetical protein
MALPCGSPGASCSRHPNRIRFRGPRLNIVSQRIYVEGLAADRLQNVLYVVVNSFLHPLPCNSPMNAANILRSGYTAGWQAIGGLRRSGVVNTAARSYSLAGKRGTFPGAESALRTDRADAPQISLTAAACPADQHRPDNLPRARERGPDSEIDFSESRHAERAFGGTPPAIRSTGR